MQHNIDYCLSIATVKPKPNFTPSQITASKHSHTSKHNVIDTLKTTGCLVSPLLDGVMIFVSQNVNFDMYMIYGYDVYDHYKRESTGWPVAFMWSYLKP